MRALTEISNFLRQARKRMSFGELSGEPLLLLRAEVQVPELGSLEAFRPQ